MKKLMLGSLLALTATGAMAKNPYAHLDNWYETCEDGGAYIDFDIERDVFNKHTIKVSQLYFEEEKEVYDLHFKVKDASTEYVPTQGDVNKGATTPYKRDQAKKSCHEALKDVAYAMEASSYENDNTKDWDNMDIKPFIPITTQLKNIIDDFQEDIRWSGSPHKIHDFHNGVFEDDAEIFIGRHLDNLPGWLRAK